MCYLGNFRAITNNKKKYVGWRRWSVSTNGKRLRSVSANYTWMKAELISRGKPQEDYDHRGFWVFKTKAKMLKSSCVGGSIFGKVVVSGIVAHHISGYRGEKVKILALSDIDFAQKYGVKCCGTLRTLNRLRHQNGLRRLKSLPKAKAKIKARPVAVGKQPVESIALPAPTAVAVG